MIILDYFKPSSDPKKMNNNIRLLMLLGSVVSAILLIIGLTSGWGMLAIPFLAVSPSVIALIVVITPIAISLGISIILLTMVSKSRCMSIANSQSQVLPADEPSPVVLDRFRQPGSEVTPHAQPMVQQSQQEQSHCFGSMSLNFFPQITHDPLPSTADPMSSLDNTIPPSALDEFHRKVIGSVVSTPSYLSNPRGGSEVLSRFD